MADFKTFASLFLTFNEAGQCVGANPTAPSPRSAPGGDIIEVSWGGFVRTDKETKAVSVPCSLWVRKNWWRDATPLEGNDAAAPYGRFKNGNAKAGKTADQGFGPLKGWPNGRFDAIMAAAAHVAATGRAAAATLSQAA